MCVITLINPMYGSLFQVILGSNKGKDCVGSDGWQLWWKLKMDIGLRIKKRYAEQYCCTAHWFSWGTWGNDGRNFNVNVSLKLYYRDVELCQGIWAPNGGIYIYVHTSVSQIDYISLNIYFSYHQIVYQFA